MNHEKWPPIEEVENLRWTNNHTQYDSISHGFCNAQDTCKDCNWKIRMLCRVRSLADKIKVRIIKRHYGIKKGW